MLDEASGTRVDTRGTVAYDLTNMGATDPPGSTDRMEGTRSMSIVAPNTRTGLDNYYPWLVSPVSTGCWVKAPTGFTAPFVMHDWQNAPGRFFLQRDGSGYRFDVLDSGNAGHSAIAAGPWGQVWTHVVGTMLSAGTVKLYVNGAQVASAAMGTAVARNGQLFFGDNDKFNGLLDECFVTGQELSAPFVCRICSCGIRGEQCTCAGPTFLSTGRNATVCGTCALPSDCTASPTPGSTTTSLPPPSTTSSTTSTTSSTSTTIADGFYTSAYAPTGTSNGLAGGSGYTLAVKFSSSAAATVTGIQFYRSTSNVSGIVGYLWRDTDQAQLGQVTFSITASGWQTATFPSPIPIVAGTAYRIGIGIPNGSWFFYRSTMPTLTALTFTTNGGASDTTNPAGTYPTAADNTEYFIDLVMTVP